MLIHLEQQLKQEKKIINFKQFKQTCEQSNTPGLEVAQNLSKIIIYICEMYLWSFGTLKYSKYH